MVICWISNGYYMGLLPLVPSVHRTSFRELHQRRVSSMEKAKTAHHFLMTVSTTLSKMEII